MIQGKGVAQGKVRECLSIIAIIAVHKHFTLLALFTLYTDLARYMLFPPEAKVTKTQKVKPLVHVLSTWRSDLLLTTVVYSRVLKLGAPRMLHRALKNKGVWILP